MVTGGLKLGGSTTFLCNLAGELIRRSVPAIVLSMERENPLASDFAAVSVPVTCQDERTTIYEDRMLATLREISAFRPNVLVANLSAMSFETLRYAPPGVLRVGVAHSDEAGVYRMLPGYAKHMDVLVTVSETIKARLEAMEEFRAVPVIYAPLGVPMPVGGEGAGGGDAGPLRLIYIGRIEREQKRAHLFPEILAGLKASGIPVHWTIAGDGPLLPWLRGHMGGTGPGQAISFAGKVDYKDVPALLARHDLFLLASDYEGLPLSLLEAMGHGLVPVVSDLPSGVGAVVDETNGRLVKPDDIAGYAREIAWLHGHRAEMAAMSLAGRRKVRALYSTGAMADRWLAIFEKTAGRMPDWPVEWKILPPVGGNPFTFSALGRWIRRWKSKL